MGGRRARIRAGGQKLLRSLEGEETRAEQRGRDAGRYMSSTAGKHMEVGEAMRRTPSEETWQKQMMSPAPQAEMGLEGELSGPSPQLCGGSFISWKAAFLSTDTCIHTCIHTHPRSSLWGKKPSSHK